MNKGGLNCLRVLMTALLLFTTFAVSWNLLADIKTGNLNNQSLDLSITNIGVSSNQSPLYSKIENNDEALTESIRNFNNPTNKKKYSAKENEKSNQTIQDLAVKQNSSGLEIQTNEISSSENQTNEVPDQSGLVASLSDVIGYSIPFETEFFYPLDETRLFADISHGESSHKDRKKSEKKDSSGEGPEVSHMKDCQEGLLIESSQKDGIKVEDAIGNGVNVVKAHRGVNVGYAYGEGMKVDFAHNDGFNVDSADVNGLDIDHVGDDGIQIFRAGKDGLVIYNAAEEGIDAIGDRGNLLRTNSPDFYGLYVYSYGASPTNPGLYVAGSFYATGTKSSVVQTSKGDEALYAMESPEVEFVASGTGKLTEGKCSITLDRLFQEAISEEIPLRIILTPKDTWSGLYIAEKSHLGFRVQAAGGEQNAEFDWLAIGRRKGYEQRPDSPFLKESFSR